MLRNLSRRIARHNSQRSCLFRTVHTRISNNTTYGCKRTIPSIVNSAVVPSLSAINNKIPTILNHLHSTHVSLLSLNSEDDEEKMNLSCVSATMPSEETTTRSWLTQDQPAQLMAIDLRQKMLGCAFYSKDQGMFLLAEDQHESGPHYDLVRTLLSQIEPTTVIVNVGNDDKPLSGLLITYKEAFELLFVPSAEFSLTSALTRIQSLLKSTTAVNAVNECENLAGAKNCLSVGCVGALLKRISAEDLKLYHFQIESMLRISGDTFRALQVFDGDTKSKKSLFDMYSHSLSTLAGRRLLKSWFLRPSTDVDFINARLDNVEFFMAKNDLRSDIRKILNNAGCDIDSLLLKLKRRTAVNDWRQLEKFVGGLLAIRECLLQSEANLITSKALELIVADDLREIGSCISEIINFDESTAAGKIVIRHDLDETLDQMKWTYANLEPYLANVKIEIPDYFPASAAKALNIVYFPQLGFLLSVNTKANDIENAVKDFQHPYTFQFLSGDTAFFKCPKTRELDEIIGDIHSQILDREIEIIQKLQELILQYEPLLRDCSEVCANLDCILALAEIAQQPNYSRPQVTESGNELIILGGKHPLIEQCVSNDTYIGASCKPTAKPIILLTGPNSSGKSVYLKQVALIVFLAHIGSFVPAAQATVPMADSIMIGLQSKDTATKNQSSFSGEVNQIAGIVRKSTSRSLVIIDEFGKGTAATDGLGLMAGLLEHLANRKGDCPKILITTHFHELFSNSLLEQKENIDYLKMDAVIDDSLTFLYRCVPGKSLRSLGYFCAAIAGVPDNIVARAKEVGDRLESHQPITNIENNISEDYHRIIKQFLEADIDLNSINMK